MTEKLVNNDVIAEKDKVALENTTETDKMLNEKKDLINYMYNQDLHDDTTCGIWCIRGAFLQKFANKKAYVLLYGVLGCIFTASYSYSTGTITTIEKRFKIPSRNTGIINVGNDISQMLASVLLSYYAGRGHRPRWMAFGMYTVSIYCVLTALPHVIYGSGEDALGLTLEYGASYGSNSTDEFLEQHRKQHLCYPKNSTDCGSEEGNLAPQILLFVAQLISGIGGSLYYTLGVSYMDDNIKKSKTPALISFSFFLRMLGPAIGYSLASFSLKLYIAPNLTPIITTSDPRWLGAWWLGWSILGALMFIFATFLALFPKTLPRAHARKQLKKQLSEEKEQKIDDDMPASFKDMMQTFKRLFYNVVLMMNNFAAVFYFLGYMPYWIFMPKYIETQYRQSASFANLITGTVGLVCSAFGILLSGMLITKYKPRARYLAAWNVLVGAISVMGIVSYAFLGCVENDNQSPLLPTGELQTKFECNFNCSCDYIKYSPVCSVNGETFISACHAGCREQYIFPNNTKIYMDCSCINSTRNQEVVEKIRRVLGDTPSLNPSQEKGGIAYQGSCPVDCTHKFYIFLAVVCLLQFSGATGRASNFLVSVRCVEEKDKAVAMGFGVMIMSLLAFIPSPILFGVILDKACMVWGKTCSGTGNCWLYNGEILRYTMNFTAAAFVTIGTLFDVVVWYYVKNLKIFEEEIELENIKE